MIKILLVDDHAIFRQGLRALLEKEADFQIVGEASAGLAVAALTLDLKPDVVVLDLMMPEMNGLEVTRQIRAENPACKIVILSMHSSDAYVANALNNGASGYVLKDASATDLIAAIRTVLKGQRYLSSPLNEAAIVEYRAQSKDSTIDLYVKLTAREREVLSLAGHGLTNAEIGVRLFISPRTVEIHRTNLMRKLCLRTPSELLRYAVARGIVLVDYSPIHGNEKP